MRIALTSILLALAICLIAAGQEPSPPSLKSRSETVHHPAVRSRPKRPLKAQPQHTGGIANLYATGKRKVKYMIDYRKVRTVSHVVDWNIRTRGVVADTCGDSATADFSQEIMYFCKGDGVCQSPHPISKGSFHYGYCVNPQQCCWDKLLASEQVPMQPVICQKGIAGSTKSPKDMLEGLEYNCSRFKDVFDVLRTQPGAPLPRQQKIVHASPP